MSKKYAVSYEISELAYLIGEIQDREKRLEALKSDEKILAVGKIAAEVAHDIRSPLAALNAIVKQTSHIPEQQRIMLRDATTQINDIANNLLEEYRIDKTEKDNSTVLSAELISLLLDTVVSEKRAQYSDAVTHIDFNIQPDSHGLFCYICASSFKRVISNLINNAFEAIQNHGKILVDLSRDNNFACITIKDNGSGMSEEFIQKILSGESVSSKKSGHGIGLYSAKKIIEDWKGNLNIFSQLKKGTTLEINLPLVNPAPWFADKLTFTQNSTVVILDDDQSIHHVWQSRIESEIPQTNLKLLHYFSPQKLLAADVNPHAFYLCDHELLECSLTGLDVIETLNLKNAVLVTSRYNEPDIRARCRKIGIKILPKSFAIYIPLIVKTNTDQFENRLKPDLILIDDNQTLTDSWKLSAQLADKNMVVFNSIAQADNAIHQYSFDTPVYIDSDLGETIKGEDYAKVLYEKGFHTIFLTTGYDLSNFDLKKMYWIRNIIEKKMPF